MVEIKPHKQEKINSCGPAVAFMVLEAAGIKKSEEEICNDMELDTHKETFLPQIAVYLKRHGLDVALFLEKREEYKKRTQLHWHDKAAEKFVISDFSFDSFERELEKGNVIAAGVNRYVYDEETPLEAEDASFREKNFQGILFLLSEKIMIFSA